VRVLEHDPARPVCELARELQGASALITAHGFQGAALLLLPPSALFFEVALSLQLASAS
jgi:hypothetical protein